MAQELKQEREEAAKVKQLAESQMKAMARKADAIVTKAELINASAEDKVKAAYLGMARAGMRHNTILETLRIHCQTFTRWKVEDPVWIDAVDAARRESREVRKQMAEDHLMMAIEQEKVDRNSVIASIFMLKAYEPETYGEGKRFQTNEGRQVEVVIRDSREQKAIPAEFKVDD